MVEIPSAAVFDTTVIVKGLIFPRRKKQDRLFQEELTIHNICKKYLLNVDEGKTDMIIPTVGLVETGAVISRLTDNRKVAEEAVTYLRSVAKSILYDYDILQSAIKIGITTKASGFDVLFLTCSKLTQAPLITDDRKLAQIAKQYGCPCIFVRDLL